MTNVSYPSVDLALREVTDTQAFERASFYVLRPRYPDLDITAPTADAGKDLKVSPLGSAREDVRVMVSIQGAWTVKLDAELRKIEKLAANDRPAVALFVTNENATEAAIERRKVRAQALNVKLEVVGRTQLATALNDPSLRWVAEFELNVEPLRPRSLLTSDVFARMTLRTVPGFDAEIVGREDEIEAIRRALWSTGSGAPRIVVLEGPGGVGKTRLAVTVAGQDFLTSVLPVGVHLPPDEVRDIPAGSASVLVVDDVHRSRDLSGIKALLMDPRFDETVVLMTSRPGLTERALADAGLNGLPTAIVAIEPLDRDVMASLIRGWGIDSSRFATSVVELARGVPLIAHAMCEGALENGRFDAKDMVDVLNSRVAARLDAHDRGVRAVAVALSLASTVTVGADGAGSLLGEFRGAVTHMPQPSDVAACLEELADAGLAQVVQTELAPGDRDFVYAVKPDLMAASLVASAMRGDAGVRVRVSELLAVIGFRERRTGADVDGQSAAPTRLTAYGGLTVMGRLDSSLATHQFGLLAQAAAIDGDHAVLERLAREVLALLPPDPTIRDWRVVVTLASVVVPHVPRLFTDLHERLVRSWPPQMASSPSLWFDTSGGIDDYELSQLESAISEMVRSHGVVDPSASTRLMMSAASLIAAETGAGSRFGSHERDSSVARAVKAVVAPRAYETWEEALGRRSTVIAGVSRWAQSHLEPADAAPALTSQVPREAVLPTAIAALVEAINPVSEDFVMGTPEAADVISISAGHLPPTTATSEVLGHAGSALAGLVGHLDWESGRGDEVVRSLVGLPRELWALGRRGLPRGGPLPQALRRSLAEQGRLVEQAFAQRWPALPLWVRYEVIRSVQAVRPTMTLNRRAASGSAAARRALGDAALNDLMMLAPLGRSTSEELTDAKKAARLAARGVRDAQKVAARLTSDETVELLRVLGRIQRDWQLHDPAADFVDALMGSPVDAQAAEDWVDTVLGEQHVPHAGRLLASLVAREPEVTLRRVRARARSAVDFSVLMDAVGYVADGHRRRELIEATLDLVIALTRKRVEADAEESAAGSSSADGSAIDVEKDGVRGEPDEAGTGASGRAGWPGQAGRQVAVAVSEVAGRAARLSARALGAVGVGTVGRGLMGPARQVQRLGRVALTSASREHDLKLPAAAVGESWALLDATPDWAELNALARSWVFATWRLPDDEAAAVAEGSAAIGWRIDALVRLGLEGPPGALAEVLQRSTYRARRARRRASTVDGDPDEILTDAQAMGLVEVLARAVRGWSRVGIGDPEDDYNFGSAVSVLAQMAPDETAEVLALWLMPPDGDARRWPYGWREPIYSMDARDRIPFGLALRQRLNEALQQATFPDPRLVESAQFEVDRVVGALLHDAREWSDTIREWVVSQSTQARAASVLSKMWRAEAWAELVVALVAAGPRDDALEAVIDGLVPRGVGPDLKDDLEPRSKALDNVLEVVRGPVDGGSEDGESDPVLVAQVESFVENAKARLAGVLEDYERDAARRRKGY